MSGTEGGPVRSRRTVNDWLAVSEENSISKSMALARFALGDLGNFGGVGLRAVYMSGPPGIGKTYSVVAQEQAWQAVGLRPLRFRPRNVNDLKDYFAEARGRSPLIMEEADIIFRSKAMFEILKQATDPLTPDIFHRIEKIEGEKVAVEVSLNVPIVVTTNMDLLGETGWDKALLADRDALFNRSAPVIFPDDPEMLWEWSVYLALTSHLTMNISRRNPNGGKPLGQSNPLSVQAAALEWFTDNVDRLKVIAPRTLKQIAEVMGRAHINDMPQAICDEKLSSLLGVKREKPINKPVKANWVDLLKNTPKSAPRMKLAA